jgi:hypothetical protein
MNVMFAWWLKDPGLQKNPIYNFYTANAGSCLIVSA